MNCNICNEQTVEIFRAIVLNKYNIRYFQCPNCLFIQTEKPYWLEEAYLSPISILDTGILLRNIDISKKLTVLLPFFTYSDSKILDYAGGYGILVRLMRDIGYDFYWYDKYCKNLFSKGFEYEKNYQYKIVTAFELLEHLENPINEIEKIINRNKCETLFFSTNLTKTNNIDCEWWYFAFESGQHISFFNHKTLKYLANKFSMNIYSFNAFFHIFSEKQEKVKKLENTFNKYLKYYPRAKEKLNSKTFSDHLYLKSIDR